MKINFLINIFPFVKAIRKGPSDIRYDYDFITFTSIIYDLSPWHQLAKYLVDRIVAT